MSEVECHHQALRALAALIGEDLALDVDRMEAADAQRAARPSQRDQAAIERQDRPRVSGKVLDVAGLVDGVEGQPGLARREPRLRRAIPLHRGPFRVATETEPGLVLFPGVLDPLRRDLDPREPDLVAIIHRW